MIKNIIWYAIIKNQLVYEYNLIFNNSNVK